MAGVSIRDVADRAGVSVGTVSNVLNRPDKVAAGTVDRVTAAIAELGFVRNDAARQLRAGRSRMIALVLLDVGNPFFAEVARGAQERAAADGLVVSLGSSDENPVFEAAHLEQFEQQRASGVLLSPVGDPGEAIARLRATGIPVVLVDHPGAAGAVGSVSVDDVAGGRLAAEHLLAGGRRRLAFVGGPLALRQVADRLRGARDAVAEVPGASLEVIGLDALSVVGGRAAGRAIVERPAHERPDAVFAANDLVALGVIQAMRLDGAGLAVPEEIAIVGYDDIDYAAAAVVPLSSVRQPSRQIGRAAVDLLIGADGDPAAAPRRVEFPPELIVRESSR